jgi:hypothetical protein
MAVGRRGIALRLHYVTLGWPELHVVPAKASQVDCGSLPRLPKRLLFMRVLWEGSSKRQSKPEATSFWLIGAISSIATQTRPIGLK